MRLVASCLISLTLAGAAFAAPVPPALQAELLGVFHRYDEAVKAGHLDAAFTFWDAKSRAEAAQELRTPAERKAYLEMGVATAPDTIEVVHGRLSDAGQSATLIAATSQTRPDGRKDPEAPDGVAHGGLTMNYVREGGAWKLAALTFGPAPGAGMACPDERSEPAAAYAVESQTSVGGPITRVEFDRDHTLVVISVVGDPQCLFLPAKAQLAGAGVSPETLVPYAMISADGNEHRTDKHKVLVSHATVTPED